MNASVVAVHLSSGHTFSKITKPEIELVVGHGARGDAHYGVTVKHRSRVARDPNQPNLRQIHLLQSELFAALAVERLSVSPGEMGENVTTVGIDLLALSEGACLRLGQTAVVQITGLRNPCSQIEGFQSGLLAAVLDRAPDGKLTRKAGVMGVVITAGIVQPGDNITIVHEPSPFKALQPV